MVYEEAGLLTCLFFYLATEHTESTERIKKIRH
jgi:hypothetical protein